MRSHGKFELKSKLAQIELMRFQLAAVELKRILDKDEPFDFMTYVKSGRVLLVGEGNLSFSLALTQLAGSKLKDMTSTTFQSASAYTETTSKNAKALRIRGVPVIAGVDATNLTKWFGSSKFDLIVFQFPNVGSRSPLYGRNPNHVLVRRFLRSAAGHLGSGGRVAITAVNSPHYDGAFDVDGAAERNEYETPVAYPFYFSDYPGYAHVKTKDDGTSVANSEIECVTYAFDRKRRVGRKWMLR